MSTGVVGLALVCVGGLVVAAVVAAVYFVWRDREK
jgi:hypothetical protein